MSTYFVCALFLMISVSARATVVPHALISEGTVLQQGMDVPIWGTATNGEKVTVKFLGQEVSTVAKDGRWMVKLKRMKAGGPFPMTISGENTIELKEVFVGEVWICSGQSNMEWMLLHAHNAKATIAASTDPQLRLCVIEESSPCLKLPSFVDKAKWVGAGSNTSWRFSAVGYFFGRDLRKALNVPVGLILSSVGGTRVEAWINPDAYANDPELRSLKNSVNDSTGCLYNKMIAPLQPFAIRGAIWYQGESNCNNAKQYQSLFPAMVRSWRQAWGQGDFPFLYVQIAPCINWTPEIRESQLLCLTKINNTAMVGTMDVGEERNIHPLRKEPVGARLAIAARAVAYGEKIESMGPLYDSLKIEDTRAVISFTHIGKGLEARGGELKGFTISDDGKTFVPATASIDGEHVVVSAPTVTKPVAARYGWGAFVEGNLYNKEGLPASPFRTNIPESK